MSTPQGILIVDDGRREKFDAVFLNPRMPSPDGLEVLRRMCSSGLNRATPVAKVTGEEGGASLARVMQGLIPREKLRFLRAKVRCNVSIESRSDRGKGTTLDLSLGGALVECRGVFPVGSLADASFELSQAANQMRATARVVHQMGMDCMGFQFQRTTHRESRKVENFLLPRILEETENDFSLEPQSKAAGA